MNPILKLIGLGALALTTALPAWAEITLTDLKGRTVTLADTPDRVLLGFYYEDFIAITGPGGIDKVVAISRAPWAEWRPMQWEAYKAVYPQIDTLPDVGDTETSTFSVEAAIAAKPDVALLAGWQFDALDHAPYGRFCVAPGHQIGFNDLKAIEVAGFAEAIAGKRPEPFNFRAGLRIQTLVETIKASSKEGKWMTV